MSTLLRAFDAFQTLIVLQIIDAVTLSMQGESIPCSINNITHNTLLTIKLFYRQFEIGSFEIGELKLGVAYT